MTRRRFVAGMAGAIALTAFAPVAMGQQRERARRVAALLNLTSNDPEAQARLAGFLQGMQEEGWQVGRNLRVDIRWGEGDRTARAIGLSLPAPLLARADEVIE